MELWHRLLDTVSIAWYEVAIVRGYTTCVPQCFIDTQVSSTPKSGVQTPRRPWFHHAQCQPGRTGMSLNRRLRRASCAQSSVVAWERESVSSSSTLRLTLDARMWRSWKPRHVPWIYDEGAAKRRGRITGMNGGWKVQ